MINPQHRHPGIMGRSKEALAWGGIRYSCSAARSALAIDQVIAGQPAGARKLSFGRAGRWDPEASGAPAPVSIVWDGFLSALENTQPNRAIASVARGKLRPAVHFDRSRDYQQGTLQRPSALRPAALCTVCAWSYSSARRCRNILTAKEVHKVALSRLLPGLLSCWHQVNCC